MKFGEYEKLFLEEYRRIYYPKSKVSLTSIFEHMAIYMLYTSVYGMFTGFLLGFQTMNQKKVEELGTKFAHKIMKYKDKDEKSYLN